MTTTQLSESFNTFQMENAKFEAGNAAAGTRARKALAEMSKLIKLRRNEITEVKNERKETKATA